MLCRLVIFRRFRSSWLCSRVFAVETQTRDIHSRRDCRAGFRCFLSRSTIFVFFHYLLSRLRRRFLVIILENRRKIMAGGFRLRQARPRPGCPGRRWTSTKQKACRDDNRTHSYPAHARLKNPNDSVERNKVGVTKRYGETRIMLTDRKRSVRAGPGKLDRAQQGCLAASRRWIVIVGRTRYSRFTRCVTKQG